MLTSDSKGIYEFIFDRIYKINEELLPHDAEYREWGRKQREVLDRLWAGLAPEERKMLDDFDVNRTMQMNRRDELFYSRGLMDGIILAAWIERIKRGGELSVP
ncbi:hypothetical protein EDC14_101393 [Hydrogenispora ethanolica]|uniref:Uncharacterized protein n=2 Tax=Hydrogenispora ethanolica TaxID=1082276 RepID=A0A4R1RRI2_HYDET|nr:hypothetical protein [Hydrogenispora ethanolica]TCL68552.1 hypothetical protein EDC14_101393 [Hydrogenispora ethanolica]